MYQSQIVALLHIHGSVMHKLGELLFESQKDCPIVEIVNIIIIMLLCHMYTTIMVIKMHGRHVTL